MNPRTRIALALALVLALGLTGCFTGEPELIEETSSAEPAASAAPMDFATLAGAWEIETTLLFVDDIEYRNVAEQSSPQWECAIDGTTMTLTTDRLEYVGELSSEGDGLWSYFGTAESLDEDGAAWTSTIEIRAAMDGADAFVGKMEGVVTPAGAEPLYTAQWDVVGARK